jgi:nitroreductase
MLKDLVQRSRSYRRFYQDVPVQREQLIQLVELARYAPTGANRQPLRFYVVNDPGKNAFLFQNVSWASQIKNWGGPTEGERPRGWILILGDKDISQAFGLDPGIAAQTILLGATEMGLGGTMFGSVKKDIVRKEFGIPEKYEIMLAIAIGKPKEKVVIDAVGQDGATAYWREADGTHHVPKRKLEDLLLE